MKKRDPSLTQIYEENQPRFEALGIISNSKYGKTSDKGFVFHAMKGYGKNIPMAERRNKPPKVTRRGWRGLKTMALYQRNYRDNLNNTKAFVQQLEQIKIRGRGRQTTLGEF